MQNLFMVTQLGWGRVSTRPWFSSVRHTPCPSSDVPLCSWGFRARIFGKTNWASLQSEPRIHKIPSGRCPLVIRKVSRSFLGQEAQLVSWEDHPPPS